MTRDATASPEDGEKTQKSNDQNEQQAETTALVKQRPRLILTESERIRLGKILQPSLQNSLESLVSQLKHLIALFLFNLHRGFFTSDWHARSFYRVLLVKANDEITTYRYWPFFLPADSERLAKEIFGELEARIKKDANEAPTPSSPKSSTDAGGPPSTENV